jgi:hypothetical protein
MGRLELALGRDRGAGMAMSVDSEGNGRGAHNGAHNDNPRAMLVGAMGSDGTLHCLALEQSQPFDHALCINPLVGGVDCMGDCPGGTYNTCSSLPPPLSTLRTRSSASSRPYGEGSTSGNADVVVQDGARGAIGAQEVAVEEIEAEE